MTTNSNTQEPFKPSQTKSSLVTDPAPTKPFWRRFLVPIVIVVLFGSFEILNWTTGLTSEVLVPQFGTSAQTVIGRMVFLIWMGVILGWLLVTRQVAWSKKLLVFSSVGLIILLLLACIRSIENTGNNHYVFHWRWEKTQDQRLAEFEDKSKQEKSNTFQLDPEAPQFTDFLGPNRNGVVPGPKLDTDLKAHPPKELWRRPMGESYAGFAISGGLAVTIEQRSDDEVVVALEIKTGKDIWTRAYPGYFKEELGGNGPRATPTIAGNEVFALGAAGLLVCLDLATGEEKWKANILSDAAADNITWGMSGAPLVTVDRVIVNPGGTSGKGVVAYNRQTGKIDWCSGKNRAGYSSPTLATIQGIPQVLVLDAQELASYDLEKGTMLWRFPFKTFNGINVG
ncbi:MAG: PQQ-binding-like beta-propeller repeat protein, partial [Pirellulales bacterium]